MYTKIDEQRGQTLSEALETLTPQQVLAVDRAVTAIGSFGEVRLVKAKGKVRFIQQLKSNDLLRVCDEVRE
jgi:hypothetical protein